VALHTQGECFEKGEGVEASGARAVDCYTRAAAGGNVEARGQRAMGGGYLLPA
jgi:TPR repeat protein